MYKVYWALYLEYMRTPIIKNRTQYNETKCAQPSRGAFVCAFILLSVQILLPLAPVLAAEVSLQPDSQILEGNPQNIDDLQNEGVAKNDENLTLISDQSGTATDENIETESIPPIDDSNTIEQEVTDVTEQITPEEAEKIVSSSTDVSVFADTQIPDDVASTSLSEVPAEVSSGSTTSEYLSYSGDTARVLDEGEDVTPSSTPSDVSLVSEEGTELLTQIVENNHLSTATQTPSSNVVQPEIHTVTNDENRYSFSSTECVTVGDGSFYCAKPDVVATTTNTDRVFAAPDADGDREIYIEKSGMLVQITMNTTDDDAPFYDEGSNSLVWHRLINERYQIVAYDLDSEREVVLTADHFNNMQPTRHDGTTVWQAWVGNDWDIIMEENGVVRMLTDNTTHDIDPSINGDYIIWQAFESDAWYVKVYNRITEQIETIEDANAASFENPRFVLVYDAKDANGDIETRGYDLKNKAVIPLSSQAPRMPESIPDPEQTGEKSALVVQQVQVKVKTDDEAEPLDGPNPEDADVLNDSSEITGDLMILPFEGAGTVSSSDDIVQSTTDEQIQGVHSLIIEPLEEQDLHEVIPDLIIPPVNNVDSQEAVAETL